MTDHRIYSRTSWLKFLIWCTLARDVWGQACKFYPLSENRRFERVVENIPVGQEIFRLEVFPRTELKLEAVDNSLSDISHFRYEEVDSKTVAIKIAQSLDDLVDRREPQSVLKFKLKCKGEAGTKEDFLPVTVYIEDINDHAPEFLNTPYHLAVDELTPVGLTIFRGIHAIDKDKPNTANSDVTYSIVGGNEDNAFVLSDPIEGILVVNKPLDFDKGVREYKLEIQASDHGSPQSLSTITTMTIRVKDADDQNPVFTQEIYKTSVTESPVVTGAQIRQKLNIDPPIHAYDQDIGISTPVRYKIILGNDHGFFELEEQIGDLYLVKEVDLESLPNPVLNLQIQATQVDNPVRYAIAKVDISILDVNDNSPIFEFETYNLTVVENLPSDFTVVQVHAEDKDQGENAKFSYKLIDPSEAFKIDTNAGWIRVRDPSKLDRESRNLLVLKVIAEEKTPSVNSEGVESSAMVQIHLLDANDNNPKFVPSAIYKFKISETESPGNIIGSVAAVDPDLGLNGIVHYAKQDDTLSRTVPFDVFPMNGSIYVTQSFASILLKPPVYTFFVTATDSAKSSYERRSSVAAVHINVTDTNNITPEFEGAPYEAAVGESLPAGTFVIRVMAKDPDVDTVLTFSIIRGNDEQKFLIDARNGRVITADVLDYEQRQSYDLLVQVSDGINTAATPLSVKVVDINDRQPIFTHNYYNFSVVEEIRQNITVGSVLAIDSDSGKNAAVRYSILGSRASKVFHIDQRGNIFTQRSLDREAETKLEFLVVAFDGGVPQLSGTSTVMVYVEDINDNPPTFESNNYVVNVPEEREPPYKVFEIMAEDKDSGENAEMKYNIIGGNENNAFEIDEDSGIVYTADKLNYEDQSEYKLEIVARNAKPFQGPAAASLANPVVQLVVKVQDINDGAVVFSQPSYQYGILENTPRAESIGFVNATNLGRSPQDQDITYWIGEGNENDHFWVNPNTGMIILMDTLDADPPANQRLFNLKIFARDNLSINSFNSSVPVRIEIVDVNDNFPKFTEEHYSLQLPENLQVGTKLPSFYKVEDIDSGENGVIKHYIINGSQETFFVNSSTGEVRLISVLDYETQEKLEFIVYAVDGGNPSRTGSATVVVKVQNINEYSPEFVGLPYDFWVEENAVTGTAVGLIQAVDKDHDNVKYDILQGDKEFFGIEKDTGKVYVKKNLTGRSKYGFVAQATDNGLPEVNTLGVQVNIFVRETNDFPPVFNEEKYKGYVIEKENTDRVIAKVLATDKDLQNNTVTYKITSGNEDSIFLIEPQEGYIRVNKTLAHKLNYDTKKQYILLVQAKDSHNSPQYGLTTVTIDVHDTNDHPPIFTKPAFSVGIPENKPTGHCFLKVKADSGDSVDNVTYTLGTKDVPFTVNEVSGELCTKLILDREQKDKYEFNVVATDGKFESAVAVTLEVEDENDNPPQFERGRYVISIPQESKAGRSIVQLHARDPDAANNGEVTYWIKNTYGLFEIDPQTGLVRLASSLPDHIQRNTSFEMEVFAQDHGITSSISKTTLTVRVSNIRNHPPDFEQFAYTVAIDENLSNFPLLTVHASDVDTGEAGEIGYRIIRATRPEPFQIDQKTGKISLISPLDREQVKYLELVVEARDKAPEPQFVTTVVQITVNDINDNPPVFLSTPKFLRVPLSTSQREVVYQVEAIDKDSPFNGNNVIKYEILPPNPVFSIHPKTGQIFASQALSLGLHSLSIKASDSGEESLSSFIQINVEIYKDSIDETTPVFTSVQYDVTLDDLLQPGDTVLHVRATTPNGAPFNYGVQQVHNEHMKRFSIDPKTGLITAATRLDPQEEDLHHFLVTATSETNSSHYVEAGVIVRLSGRNTRCPKFPFSEYYATVKENTAPDSAILPNLQVEEAEKFRKLSYLITEDNSQGRFYIDYKIASSVSLRVKKPLDRDTMPSILQGVYTLTVTASNQRCASSSTLKVLVEDENDNNPIFEKKNNLVELKENTPSGHVVTKLIATDKDELDEGKLRYIIVEGNNGGEFQIDLETGVLSVAKSPDRETTPVFMLRILAVDTANNTGLANVHIIILDENDWTPTFLNNTFVLNATEGRASLGAGIRLPVKDNDEGKNGELEVLIEEGNSDKHFRLGVDEEGAIFSIRKELDRESYNVEDNAIHIVKVAARDSGVPPRTGTAQVMVIIRDINDNPPKFEKEVYYQFLSENAPVGIVFETVKAMDADSARNTNLSYSFDQTYKNVPFDIDPILGTINVTRQLDISEAQEYSITLEAFDGLWKGTALLKVYVNEAAERDPRFNQRHYRFSVPENTPGALVGRMELQTQQLRANSRTVYSIVNTDSKKFFDITLEGDIFTKQGLDREAKSSHTFTVMLEESRPSTKVSVSEVTVEVLDLNDEVPTFQQSYKGSVKENVPPGTPVLIHPSISAVDNDSGNNSVVHYSLGGSGSELFAISENGAVVFSPREPHAVLDRERKEKYDLYVTATDLGNLSSSTYLTITVEDENDNAPVFQHGPLFVLLPETSKPGTKVIQVIAHDADAKGINSEIEYYIISGSKNDIRIDRITGEIYVVGTLIPETVYYLNVSATDGRHLSSYTPVNINITDVNDHRPRFVKAEYSFSMKEGDYTEEKWKVGILHAEDEDTGRNGKVDYNIVLAYGEDFPFIVDVHTGELFAKGVVDRETRSTYTFIVMALDYGEPPLNSTVNVKIEVTDVNDVKPKFFTDPYLAQVPENLDPGYKVTQIAAYDPDLGKNGLVFYKLGKGHQNKFYIDSKDGTLWTLSTLDYEKQEFFNMTVIAYDQGIPSLSSTAKLWITVSDTNDIVPEFPKSVYTLEVAESTKPGESIFQMNAGNGPFRYYLKNKDEIDTFTIDELSGHIVLTKPLDSVHRSHYRLIVTSSDDAEPPKFDSTEVNIVVGTGHGVRLFPSRLYEVSVQENGLAPLVILDLNSTDEIAYKPVKYSIATQEVKGLFAVETHSGQLSITSSLDREKKANYTVKVRVEDTSKRHRRSDEELDVLSYHLAFDEALVLVKVLDENDNLPVFENNGRPLVAAVPLEGAFGYKVTQVKATDIDEGYNGEIRYKIVQKEKDASSKFHIDPVTGIIRSTVTFSLDTDRLFKFDIKATDREGSDDGNSALTNVFIYVLPETKLVLFVTENNPIQVEERLDTILKYLSKVTKYEVKMAKLTPHQERDIEHPEATDLYVYGVNHGTNEIVETEDLLKAFSDNSQAINAYLDNFKIRRIQEVSVQEKISQMGTTEIAIIALSSVIFLGAILGIALLCSSCRKRKLRKRQTSWEQQRMYNTKNPLMGKALGNPYGSRTPTVTEAHLNTSYANGDAAIEFPDNMTDPNSLKKSNKRSRQQVPPDGASSHTRSKSPRYDRYKVDGQWYDLRDGGDSLGSGFSSWSSRLSHHSKMNNPISEL